MDVLVSINSQQLLTQMNSSLDYSYLDTPQIDAPITNSTDIVPRQNEPNPHMPAYVNNTLAWGGVPVAVRPDDETDSSSCMQELPDVGHSSEMTCMLKRRCLWRCNI